MSAEVEELVSKLSDAGRRLESLACDPRRLSPEDVSDVTYALFRLQEAAAALSRLEQERDEAQQKFREYAFACAAARARANQREDELTAAEAQVEALRVELNGELDASIQSARQVEALRKALGAARDILDSFGVDEENDGVFVCARNEVRAALNFPTAKAEESSGQATPRLTPLRWERAVGARFDAMQRAVWATDLPKHGDAILVWVNEGDLYMHSTMLDAFLDAPAEARSEQAEGDQ